MSCELRRRIVLGQYSPGAFLPAERQLCMELGTSRGTLRSAITKLVADGLLMRRHGQRTRVLSPVGRGTPSADRLAVVMFDLGRMFIEAFALLRGVRETLDRYSYPYDLVTIPVSGELRDFQSSRHGGYLFIEIPVPPGLLLDMEQAGTPLVVVNLETDLPLAATAVDHRQVANNATNVLIRMGHRRIGLVTRPPGYIFFGRFRQGYDAALTSAGIPIDESLIAVCDETDPLASYLRTLPLLQRQDRPTAIVAGRDILAKGVCKAINESGLALGRDISVISYDDVSWQEDHPYLTTYREPCFELGAAGVEALIDRLVHGRRPPQTRLIEAPLMLRRTAGPIPPEIR